MLRVRADEEGRIEAVGTDPAVGGVEFAGTVPADFLATFGLGKYRLEGGVLEVSEDWEQGAPPPP